MNTAQIIIKTDPNTKREAQDTAKQLGFSLSSVMNALLHDFVRTKSVRVRLIDEPSDSLRKSMQVAKEDRIQGKASKIFDNAKDLDAYLTEQGI